MKIGISVYSFQLALRFLPDYSMFKPGDLFKHNYPSIARFTFWLFWFFAVADF